MSDVSCTYVDEDVDNMNSMKNVILALQVTLWHSYIAIQLAFCNVYWESRGESVIDQGCTCDKKRDKVGYSSQGMKSSGIATGVV